MEVSHEIRLAPSHAPLHTINNVRDIYNREDALESLCLQPLCQLKVSDMKLLATFDLILQSKDESAIVQDLLKTY